MNGTGATPIEDEELELQFDAAMQEIYWLAGKATGYWANYFLRSVRKNGGLAVARQLLWKCGVSAGFERLKAEGRLDLSMEALILKPVFRPLFASSELARARERLREHGYEPPASE
jgi:5-methylcytosine-specific restriction protein A